MVYLPPAFTETRDEVLIAHIERHDFGLLMTHGTTGMIASQIPFLAERRDDAEYRIGGCRAEARQKPGHLTVKDRTPDAQDADRAGGNRDDDADQHALQQ